MFCDFPTKRSCKWASQFCWLFCVHRRSISKSHEKVMLAPTKRWEDQLQSETPNGGCKVSILELIWSMYIYIYEQYSNTIGQTLIQLDKLLASTFSLAGKLLPESILNVILYQTSLVNRCLVGIYLSCHQKSSMTFQPSTFYDRCVNHQCPLHTITSLSYSHYHSPHYIRYCYLYHIYVHDNFLGPPNDGTLIIYNRPILLRFLMGMVWEWDNGDPQWRIDMFIHAHRYFIYRGYHLDILYGILINHPVNKIINQEHWIPVIFHEIWWSISGVDNLW